VIYLVLGRREQGKTTLAYSMARKFPLRLVFDPRGMIAQPDALQVRERGDLQPAVDELFFRQIDEVIFSPVEDDLSAAFADFAGEVKRWVIDRPSGDRLAVIVDEASFVDLNQPSWQWVLRCSPREQIHIFITAHRPADIPVIVRAIADHWLIFPMRQEHDLRVIAERCSPKTAETVAALGDREFAHWDDTTAKLRVMRRPDRWFVPLAVEQEDARVW